MNTWGLVPPFSFPTTVTFLEKHGFLSSIASATLRRVSTFITTASAFDGKSVGWSNIPKTSLTTALSSPIG